MRQSLSTSSALRSSWAWLLPSTMLGLYVGRVFSEIMLPGPAGAILMTALAVVIAALLLRRYSFSLTWPLVALLAYIFYPYPDPRAAAAAALFSGATMALILLFRAKAVCLPGRRARASVWLPTIITLLLGLGSFSLYLVTLAPDVLPADNGELQLVATELGVAHPPGFPLYTIIAHLMTRLPFAASAAYKVNLLSAVAGALTLLFVFAAVREVTRSNLSGVIASVALGVSTTFWAQSTMANVRSFTALFAAVAIYALLRLRTLLAASGDVSTQNSAHPEHSLLSGSLATFAVIFILALSLGIAHHASLAFMGTVMILYFVLIFPAARQPSRTWLGWLLVALLGLLPLVYLPLRGAAGAQGAPGDLATLDGFLDHVLARGFSGDFFYYTSPLELGRRLLVMANVMTLQFSPALLLGMILGLALLIAHDRKLALLLGGTFAIHTLIAATYRAPQTVEYMLPAYVVAAISLGYALGWLIELGSRIDATAMRRHLVQGVAAVAVAAVTLATLSQFGSSWPSFLALHRDKNARDYAQQIFEQAPPDSVVLSDWHWATPMWYLQRVEAARPDINVRYIFPTAETYAETWTRRIREELESDRPVIATHYDEDAYAELPLPLPIGEAYLFGAEPVVSLPAGYSLTDVNLGGAIRLVGTRVEENEVELGSEIVLNVAWEPTAGQLEGTSLFVHLVDSDQIVWGQDDTLARAVPEGLTITQFQLTPRPGSDPGDYALMVGAYREQPLLDEQGQSRTQVGAVHLLPASLPLYTGHRTYRPLVQGNGERRLVGYDWDHTLSGRPRLYLHWWTGEGFTTEVQDPDTSIVTLPPMVGPWGITRSDPTIEDSQGSGYYLPFGQGIVWLGEPTAQEKEISPGGTMAVTPIFASSWPVLRDLVSSVRLVGYESDGFHWAWWDLDDGIPAMGAIPTLKWVAGSKVRDPRWLTASPEAWVGQKVEPILRLYDAFTNRPLPILDERVTQVAPWLSLGKTSIAD